MHKTGNLHSNLIVEFNTIRKEHVLKITFKTIKIDDHNTKGEGFSTKVGAYTMVQKVTYTTHTYILLLLVKTYIQMFRVFNSKKS